MHRPLIKGSGASMVHCMIACRLLNHPDLHSCLCRIRPGRPACQRTVCIPTDVNLSRLMSVLVRSVRSSNAIDLSIDARVRNRRQVFLPSEENCDSPDPRRACNQLHVRPPACTMSAHRTLYGTPPKRQRRARHALRCHA